MAFYKMISNGSKYYPVAVTVGKPVSTEQLAKDIADCCSMTVGDVFGVLLNLTNRVRFYLAHGKSVDIEGLGNFIFKLRSKAVDAPEEFDFERDVTDVRIQFLPKRKLANDGKHYTRELVDHHKIEWLELHQGTDSAKQTATSAK